MNQRNEPCFFVLMGTLIVLAIMVIVRGIHHAAWVDIVMGCGFLYVGLFVAGSFMSVSIRARSLFRKTFNIDPPRRSIGLPARSWLYQERVSKVLERYNAGYRKAIAHKETSYDAYPFDANEQLIDPAPWNRRIDSARKIYERASYLAAYFSFPDDLFYTPAMYYSTCRNPIEVFT